MISIKVRLDKCRIKKDGTYPLVFQILYKREKRIIYSPYHLGEDSFDERKGFAIKPVRGKKAYFEEINDSISSTIHQLELIVSHLEEKETDFSVMDIVDMYRSNRDNDDVLMYLQKHIIMLKEEGRMGTSEAYKSTLNCLVRYLGKESKFCFGELTPSWLNGFMSYLQRSHLRDGTINFYFRILRALYNRAAKEGILGTDRLSPFAQMKLHSVKTVKRAINEESIRLIAYAEVFNNPKLEFCRDMFMFSFYARGMPFIDMAFLKYNNILDDTIYYYRSKTRQPLQIKIIEPLRRLIAKYRNDGEYVLPILHSHSASLYTQYRSALRCYNNNLKTLSNKLQLGVPLTSYVARHSWATNARKIGASVSVISQGLGHSSEKVTYTYLAALDSSVIDEVNERMAKSFFSGL